MKIEKLSASSYKSWDNCQNAYFIENVLGWRFPPKKAADTGTIAHAALETLAYIKLAKQQGWLQSDTEIGFINIENFCIDEIIEKTYQLYIQKEQFKEHEWTDKDFKDITRYVYVVLDHNNSQFNPLKRHIIGIEQYIKLEINEEWALLPDNSQFKITGFIDLVTQIDHDTLEIIDYKTGRMTDFFSGEDIDFNYLAKKDMQMRFYHWAIAEKYGCDKIYALTMFFLKYSKPITVTFSCDDLIETKERIKNRFLEIKDTLNPKLNRTWRCTKFCPFGKNTFENTQINPIIQFMNNGIANLGNYCTICDQVKFEVDRKGLEWTTNNMKKS